LPSQARSNCQARVAFWLESGLSRSLLNCEAATRLGDVGEIVVRKPGTVGLLQGRSPKVTDASYALLPHPPKQAGSLTEVLIEAEPSNGNGNGRKWTPEQESEVCERHDRGESDTAIAGALWHSTSYYIARVRSILESNNNNKADENAQDPPVDGEHERERVVVVVDAGTAALAEVDDMMAEVDGEIADLLAEADLAKDLAEFDAALPKIAVEWCEFCERTLESTTLTTFAECPSCGVAVCASCANDQGLCPDCQKSDD